MSMITHRTMLGMVLAWLAMAGAALAQTTSFSYQGKLTDGGTPANGAYDLQFALWDSPNGGTQIGSNQTLASIAVSNGVFTVGLDFGATSFPGADRFLEIGARPAGVGAFSVLTPRQQVTSSPYAVRSANAASANALSSACVGCITSAQIATIDASKLTGIIPVTVIPPSDGNYIQNSTTAQPASFHITGNGTIGGSLLLGTSGKALFGTTTSLFKMEVVDTFNGLRVQTNNAGGTIASFGGNGAFLIDAPGVPGGRLQVKENGDVSVGTTSSTAGRSGLPSRVNVIARANVSTPGSPFVGQSGIGAVGGLKTSSGFGSAGHGVVAIGGDASGGGFSGEGLFATAGFADAATGTSNGDAALFVGTVAIDGDLDVFGTKDFLIDHPLDPANKYLRHAAIESSEVLDVYSGNVVTDANGDAIVTLPAWFEALNKDLRYQLTVIGTFAQAIVAKEVASNQFSIKTSAPAVRVSWQVTGVRSDAAMLQHPLQVEEDKPAMERGTYLSPTAFGEPEEKGTTWAHHPELMRQLKDRRAPAQPPPSQHQ